MPDNYECEITVLVEADSPQEAANAAQFIIDHNVEVWVFDVRNLNSGEVTEGVVAHD